MAAKIPNSVIGATASVLASYYYSHSRLNALFMESGAPGDAPEGNCEAKCTAWLKRCNDDPEIDGLAVLGQVMQPFMDQEWPDDESSVAIGKKRIRDSLAKSQLTYQMNGFITLAGASPAAKTLADYLRAGDFASIEAEFERAIGQLDRDPHAAITAASSIIEAVCKTYIETFGLEMPGKQTISPLWKCVQTDLGLNIDATLGDDQRRILQGLASIVEAVSQFQLQV